MSEAEKERIRELILSHKWPPDRHNAIDHNRQIDIIIEQIEEGV